MGHLESSNDHVRQGGYRHYYANNNNWVLIMEALSKHYYSKHFCLYTLNLTTMMIILIIDEEMEAQRGQITCSK